MNFGDRLNKAGGLGIGTNNGLPCFGNIYFVDGTNGDSGNDGDNPSEALDTTTNAITAQAAASGSLGDVIYVLPGTYVESITGNMASVQIIGAASYAPGAVLITPDDGSAYTGTMAKSAWHNVCFKNSSGTNGAFAACSLVTMNDSVIDNCYFMGGTGNTNALATGLRIGTETTAVEWEKMSRSRVTNNVFGYVIDDGATACLEYGIVFGLSDAATEYATRMFAYSLIGNNVITAAQSGILMAVGIAGGIGGVIQDNIIAGSADGSGQCGSNAIKNWTVTNRLTKVVGNFCSSGLSPIIGFKTQNMYDNTVGQGTSGDTPSTHQYPGE